MPTKEQEIARYFFTANPKRKELVSNASAREFLEYLIGPEPPAISHMGTRWDILCGHTSPKELIEPIIAYPPRGSGKYPWDVEVVCKENRTTNKNEKKETKNMKPEFAAYSPTVKRMYTPSKIITNGPATIVFWKDGTKTIVKKSEGETSNPYTAFCAALAKKVYGNNSQVNKIVATTKEEK